MDAQPIKFSRLPEFGTLSSQEAEGEHPAHLGYVSAPLANLSEESRWTRISTEPWFWELHGILVSLVGVSSICGVLLAYGDKPAPRLPHHIAVGKRVFDPKELMESTADRCRVHPWDKLESLARFQLRGSARSEKMAAVSGKGTKASTHAVFR